MRTTPPFRADHVGSFLRPARLAEARRLAASGQCSPEELRTVEDECIRELVARQEEVGLRGITDGEFRRAFFHTDFLSQLQGVTIAEGDFVASFRKDDGSEIGFRPPTMKVTGKLRHEGPIQGRDFDFLSNAVSRRVFPPRSPPRGPIPKVTIPAPSMLHFRGGRKAISEDVYPDLEDFYDDLTAAYREEVSDLAQRGCRYLQLDDTNLAYLCDPEMREKTRARGDDPDDLIRTYCRLVNDSVKERPEGMVVSVHLCRGNFKSAWVAQGGYEPVAEILFNEMAIAGFFLEYDDERSGDFAPLRFMPPGKIVVLGLMSSKRPEVEESDDLRRRIDEAAQHVPLEQCCLSHQCGFSSTEHGNELTEDDEWRKLERCVEVANAVWG